MKIDLYRRQALQAFATARRRAFWEQVRGRLRGEPTALLSFEAVRTALGLTFRIAEGMRDVPLDDIVGSVDRVEDFTRRFYPRREDLKHRWVKVAELVLSSGLGPVSLFRVSEIYFVDDGNHRVSVARAMGAPSIEAEVWRYPCRIRLTRDLGPEDLPNKAALLEFLRHTDLDRVRPDHQVDLTSPERYAILEEHIAGHAKWLEDQRGGKPVPLGEAVASWYDRVYLPTVKIICDLDLCREFPHLTEGDLYVILLEHRRHLSRLWERPVSLREAIQDYVRHHGRRPWTRLRRLLRGHL
ncbi:MAG: hypothetical protein H5T59_04575 [Anaerolineae bacterium]|nr:hypothetical protein [Anaerolineae bacterium]